MMLYASLVAIMSWAGVVTGQINDAKKKADVGKVETLSNIARRVFNMARLHVVLILVYMLAVLVIGFADASTSVLWKSAQAAFWIIHGVAIVALLLKLNAWFGVEVRKVG